MSGDSESRSLCARASCSAWLQQRLPKAAFGVTVNKAEPGSKNAGAHSQFDLDITFTGGEDVRDLTVHLPPGLVGDPTSAPVCTEAQLNADTCPPQSQIGTTITTATVILPSDTTINGVRLTTFSHERVSPLAWASSFGPTRAAWSSSSRRPASARLTSDSTPFSKTSLGQPPFSASRLTSRSTGSS